MAQIFHCKPIYLYTQLIFTKKKYSCSRWTVIVCCPKNLPVVALAAWKTNGPTFFCFPRPWPKRVFPSRTVPWKRRVWLADKTKNFTRGTDRTSGKRLVSCARKLQHAMPFHVPPPVSGVGDALRKQTKCPCVRSVLKIIKWKKSNFNSGPIRSLIQMRIGPSIKQGKSSNCKSN